MATAVSPRKSAGLWIPAPLDNRRDLSRFERDLIAKIHALSSSERDCFASNAYLADALHCSIQHIANTLCRFSKEGRVRIRSVPDLTSANGRRRFLRVMPMSKWSLRVVEGGEAIKQPGYSGEEVVQAGATEQPSYSGEYGALTQKSKCHARDPYSAERRVLDKSGGGESCGTPPACACAHETAAAANTHSVPPTPTTAPKPVAVEQPAPATVCPAPIPNAEHPTPDTQRPTPDPCSVALLAEYLGELHTAQKLAGNRPPDEMAAIIKHAQRPGVNSPRGLVIKCLRDGDAPPEWYLKAQRQAFDRGTDGAVNMAPKLYDSLECPKCHRSQSLRRGGETVIACECGTHWRAGSEGRAELVKAATPRTDSSTMGFLAEMQAIRRAERAALSG